MVSHENKVILFAILVALPVTLGALRVVNDYWFDVPAWAGGAAVILVAVIVPQLYLGYSEG
ncbi:hypothetical protein ZOD2009_22232 [Haladaptatus paucihalophilus DX253]|uniref:Uncharacterized protein n=1 Tax=Haladaptatus paucihalophilus DX253 TaxID=797209 RepID=E7R052_HALPU|nr:MULTISPECIES: hypothetical protein [Haladaptatus]EFW89946.1 hypothetical protein ZOD2009_22232 [Haladaptatus paucihalophilus DX253]GKZ12959.1 hypothetical protein HAL_08400 [Haladaptatus sp. T7]SHK59017.1 hypothetical protein SAMN05444342_1776 [Haladaptatus paucihalophilus DX253]